MSFNSFENYPMSWKPKISMESKPMYIALAKQLESDIENGILLPGTKLPPQRELADYLGINVSTVSRAFKICSNKAILRGTVGSGTFVAYNINTNVFVTPQMHTPSFIEMSSMMPETILQEDVISLLQYMLAEPDSSNLFQYANKEPFWHKEAAVKLILRTGFNASANNILSADGGQNALAAILSGLFSPGDRIGVDTLVYPGLKSAAKLFGVQLIPISQKNGQMSEDGIIYAYKNHGIKAIYIMPDFHNPTNHTMSAECREMIAIQSKRLDLLVIEDAINSLLSPNPLLPVAAMAPDNTIYIFSLSKAILPALRIAYIVCPTKKYKELDNALYNINLSQSALLTELAARLIVSGKLENLLKLRRRGLIERNKMVNDILQGYDVAGGMYSLSRWLLLPKAVSGLQFEQLCLENGVYVYGCERFAVGNQTPPPAVRLAICAPDSLEKLKDGLLIIKNILKTF